MASLTIGEVAERTGLTGKAIRLYETRGLMARPRRTQAGYRTYSEADVAVLRFIQRARTLGLGLDEIKQILDLQRGGAQPCRTVLRLLDTHVREIDETMTALRGLRRTLIAARDAARASEQRGEQAVVCRIIEGAPTRDTSPRVRNGG